MYKEYDVVIARNPLPNVPKGTMGAVLIVYENSTHYEVEFLDSVGNSLNVLTVSEDDLELANTQEEH
jgi:hypothetical protein